MRGITALLLVLAFGCASIEAGMYSVQRTADKFSGKKTVRLPFVLAPDTCTERVSNMFRDRVECALVKTSDEAPYLSFSVISFSSWTGAQGTISFKVGNETVKLGSGGSPATSTGIEGSGANSSVYTSETFIATFTEKQLRKILEAEAVLVQVSGLPSTTTCISKKVRNKLRRFAAEELGYKDLKYTK